MATAPPVSTASTKIVEQQVLAIVARLVSELSGGSSSQPALSDSLDRDLGISSLERVELLLRLEQGFGIRLADAVMAEAATPQDLVTAIRSASPARTEALPSAARETLAAPTNSSTTVPSGVRSLVDAFRWHADRAPDRIHLHVRNDDGTETPLTYGELWSGAAAVSAGLREMGISKGDRVAVMLRTERAFFETFLAALIIAAIPVPLYPPLRAEDLLAYARRQQAILRNAEARVLVTFAEAESMAAIIRSQVPSLHAVTTADRLRIQGETPVLEQLAPEDPALIQYTSGSTGDPKGVLLSHANILANVRAIGERFEIRSDDAAVSWLPLYHDMGLIGLWLGSLYYGVPAAIMSPLAFLSRPSRWLWAIHAHHGTISAAPNFAYDLCARKIPDAELERLDLSRWRIAVNGSEAVSPDTIERFTRRFAPYGFRAEAMCPAYGLAESSVALTLSVPRRAPRVDGIAREPFERAREIRLTAESDPRALRFVSCGRPITRHEVRIVDAANRPVAERVEGRIQFRGPSVTAGYFHNPDVTDAVMHDGWMDSGDLGYQADGELFVTGREKDVIKQGGRNLRAEEIEGLVSRVPGVRPNCVAAFGVPDPETGTERAVVVAETRERDAANREALRRAVRDAVVSGIGTPPDIVVIANPRTVLKTSSGKTRRSAMRTAYLKGTLGTKRSTTSQWAWLFTGAVSGWIQRSGEWLERVLFTGWILLFVVVSLPILLGYLALRPPGRHADRAVKRWSWLAVTLCGLTPRVVGAEHLDRLGSAILVANHASYIDSIVLMAAIPVAFRFLAKRTLMRYPIVGTVIRKAEHLTIEKSGMSDRLAGADAVERCLRDGDRLLIFPEGTFARRPGLLPFRLGAFRAAVDATRPVVPIALGGTRQVLPDGTWLFRHRPITVTIGEPLEPQGQGWREMVRLRDAAVDQVARACGESRFASHAVAATGE